MTRKRYMATGFLRFDDISVPKQLPGSPHLVTKLTASLVMGSLSLSLKSGPFEAQYWRQNSSSCALAGRTNLHRAANSRQERCAPGCAGVDLEYVTLDLLVDY
jgi:hypothetical protein